MEIPPSPKSSWCSPSPLSNSLSASWGQYSPSLRSSGSHPYARYLSDYTELQILGKGGFGEVFKVQNLLDGCYYAIKRIKLEDNENLNKKILREVSALSRLSHKNIVRYYQSWIESGPHSLPNSPKAAAPSPPRSNGLDHFSSDSSSSSDEEDAPQRNAHAADYSMGLFEFEGEEEMNGADDYSSDTQPVDRKKNKSGREQDTQTVVHGRVPSGEANLFLSCNICKKKYADWEVTYEEWGLIEVRMHPWNLCVECYKEQLKKTGMDSDCVQIRRTAVLPQYLYIQMEFCESTLRDLIDGGTLWVDTKYEKIWRLFRQIVEALNYLHSMNYIHRDCKPSNIFVVDGIVKLGDFGLATGTALMEHEHIGKRTNSVMDLIHLREEDQLPGFITGKERTSNVGTFLYISPEISHESQSAYYSEKVDIYSLGIILFELWHPFDTIMERYKTIEALRNAKTFPIEFSTMYPTQCSMILQMIKDDPEQRPSAAQLLTEITPDDTKPTVRGFGAHLARVSMENNKLRDETEKLQQTVKMLQDKLKLLELENSTLKQGNNIVHS